MTRINGTRVQIVQETVYPFSDKISFRLEPEAPTAFDLEFRIPPNSGNIRIDAVGAAVYRGERIIRLAKRWQPGDTVTVDFDFQVARRLQHDGRQAYYEWGPLVFSLPIRANIEPWTAIERDGVKTSFYDYRVTAQDTRSWATLDAKDARMRKVDLPDGDVATPWTLPLVGLKGTLRTFKDEPVEVTLVPLGCTVLRRTTFPLNAEHARQAAKAQKGVFFSDEEDPMRDF